MFRGMEGCDTLGSIADLTRIANASWSHNNWLAQTTGGRFAGGSLVALVGNAWVRLNNIVMAGTDFFLQFQLNLEDTDGNYAPQGTTVTFLTLYNNGAAEQVTQFKFDDAGRLIIEDASGGNVFTGPPGIQTFDVFHTWQVRARALGPGLGQVEVRVGATIVANLVGDFSITANDVDSFRFDSLGVSFASGAVVRLDDIIWFDSSSAVNNTFFGDKRITAVPPDAEGFHNDWAQNGQSTDHDCVGGDAGEALPGTDDGDATFLSIGAVGSYSVGFENIPADTTGIVAVQARHTMRKDDGGAQPGDHTRALMREGGNDANINPDIDLTASYQTYLDPNEHHPGGGVDGWTAAQFNSLEGGVTVFDDA